MNSNDVKSVGKVLLLMVILIPIANSTLFLLTKYNISLPFIFDSFWTGPILSGLLVLGLTQIVIENKRKREAREGHSGVKEQEKRLLNREGWKYLSALLVVVLLVIGLLSLQSSYGSLLEKYDSSLYEITTLTLGALALVALVVYIAFAIKRRKEENRYRG